MTDGRIILTFILGMVLGLIICGLVGGPCAEAHPPCDQQEPVCHYVQVVNPITGQLEQQYVCE